MKSLAEIEPEIKTIVDSIDLHADMKDMLLAEKTYAVIYPTCKE